MDLGKVCLLHKSAKRNADKRNSKNLGTGLRLFLMATWKSGLGNFSGTNLSHVTMGGNLLH